MTKHRLAVLGGRPAFDETLHVGRPNIGDRDRVLSLIGEALDRRWLTNGGVLVQELESALAAYLGVRHCITMCNGTVALEIAVRALGLRGEVILPSYTFVATAHCLQWQEITPVFCDIDPQTHRIDPARIEGLITPRTTGVLAVHLWGEVCDIKALSDLAERNNLRLLFDAAHAFGCSHRGRMIGNFGTAEVFSFHATKFFNTFEGGAVATNDDTLARRIRLMKNFGFSGLDNVVHVGTNGKMTEVSAAMGLVGLESVNTFIRANRRNYDAYRDALSHVPGVRLLPYDEEERRNFQYVVVEIDEAETGLTRDQLISVLHAENVRARRYFWPGCHRMEPYRSLFPDAGLLLPATEAVAERVIVLPTGTSVSVEDVRGIGAIVRLAIDDSESVKRALGVANPGGCATLVGD